MQQSASDRLRFKRSTVTLRAAVIELYGDVFMACEQINKSQLVRVHGVAACKVK